jgi:FixJ family two-component response regulator
VKYQKLPILFLTGFADRAAMTGVPEADIIGKPFADVDLADKIDEALDAARTRTVPHHRVSAST